MRSLAGRSAEAAKEIKQLIGASVENVESGSAQVAQAGQAMGEIVSSVQRVSDLIGEITASSTEQRDGIAQVNQAQRLAEVVAVFNVGAVAARPAPRPAMPAPAAAAPRPAQAPRVPAPARPAAARIAPPAAKPAPAPAAKAAADDGDWESF